MPVSFIWTCNKCGRCGSLEADDQDSANKLANDLHEQRGGCPYMVGAIAAQQYTSPVQHVYEVGSKSEPAVEPPKPKVRRLIPQRRLDRHRLLDQFLDSESFREAFAI